MKRLLIALVRAYRLLLSPWLGSACRFEPTCSRYAIEALQQHGALGGSALAGWRLLRCHPLCVGGFDPVPDNPPWSSPRRAAPDVRDAILARQGAGPPDASSRGPGSGLFTELKEATHPATHPGAHPRDPSAPSTRTHPRSPAP